MSRSQLTELAFHFARSGDQVRSSEYSSLAARAALQTQSIEASKLSQAPSHLSSRHDLPANLTQREVEVLRLVAQGKTNRQIARVLGLTAKTVTNHLTHIFNKINCENRAGATAFAFRPLSV